MTSIQTIPSCLLATLTACLALTACAQAGPQEPTEARPVVRPAAPTVERRELPPEAVGALRYTLPKGWSVATSEGAVAVLNPGFRAEDTLDALVVLATEPRGAAEQSAEASAVDLLRNRLAALAVDLQQQQVECRLTARAVRTVELASGIHGAELTVDGTVGGLRPATVWVAARADRDHVAVALVVALRGKSDAYLRETRRLLGSAVFAVAEPAAAEAVDRTAAALAGMSFGSESFGSDASLTTVYAFGGGGMVSQRTMFSSPFGGSDKEQRGRFEVRGERVTMRIGDEVTMATVQRRDGRITGLQVGRTTYRRL
ncbi:MAG: hypothetical protein RL398_513 [Planctomycetota bacterium]|jgi:hypothetical protein